MADNGTASSGPTIAWDDIGGVALQRVKVTHGADGAFADASTATPLPASTPNATASGTITAANASITTGAGTAGSSVTLTVPDNHTSWTAIIGGTFSAGTTLAFQCSIDGTTWYYTNGRRNMATLGSNEGVSLTSTDVVGGAPPIGGNPSLWKGTAGAVRYIRVTASTFTAADAVTVRIDSSAGPGGTFLLGSIPAGTSNIGSITWGGDATVGTMVNSPPVGTITGTASQVLAAGTYRALVFDNQGTDFIYLGATGVTATSYFKRIAPGETLTLTPPFMPTNAVFAIAASGTQPLAVGVIT